MASALSPFKDHENGDQGGGEQQNQGGKAILAQNEKEEGQGHHGGQGDLGQILAEIGIEELDALDQGVGEFPGRTRPW